MSHASISHIASASTVDSGEAGAPEVTHEMLIAGSREMENYYLGDGRYCIQDDGLTAIYVAMERAMKGKMSRRE